MLIAARRVRDFRRWSTAARSVGPGSTPPP
jgi:hypothetical protein